MKWEDYIGHAVFLGSVLFTIIVVLTFRAYDRRQTRRSPLHGKKVGHIPGQQLQMRVEHHHDELVEGLAFMMVAFPLFYMVWATDKVDWSRVHFGSGEALFALAAVLMVGYGFLKFKRHYRLRKQAQDGLLAERVTGMQLNRLIANGCTVLHDLPCDLGNIDHVLIAPSAVFSIETKSFRKPNGEGENHKVRYDGNALRFPDFVNTEATQQAERNAQWLRRHLRDTLNLDVPVVAAVSLPGWFVEKTDAGKTASVKIFSPMGRGAEFLALGPEKLTAATRALISSALAQNYPQLEDRGSGS